MTTDSTVYRISSDDPGVIIAECNRIFGLIADRLDRMEGFRGEPQLWDRLLTSSDVVFNSSLVGIILKDNGNPPDYWRVTINSAGTIVRTNLGRVYK
jgi:hypothetical protein